MTAPSTAAWQIPTETAALPRLNHGITVCSISSKPPPSGPIRWLFGISTPKVIGLDAFARSPRPCQSPDTATPGVSAAMAYRSTVSASGLSVDVTYSSAWPADVTQLLRASSTIPAPLRFDLDTGAQKCEREPRSENASVASDSPLARRNSRSGAPDGGAAATVIAALTCMR